MGIDDYPEVSDKILDLLALVKTHTAVNGIGNGHPAQAFFKSTALGIGAIQYREIPVVEMIAEFLFLDGIGHKFPFVVVGLGTHQFNLFALYIFRPQVLGYLTLIAFDD